MKKVISLLFIVVISLSYCIEVLSETINYTMASTDIDAIFSIMVRNKQISEAELEEYVNYHGYSISYISDGLKSRSEKIITRSGIAYRLGIPKPKDLRESYIIFERDSEDEIDYILYFNYEKLIMGSYHWGTLRFKNLLEGTEGWITVDSIEDITGYQKESRDLLESPLVKIFMKSDKLTEDELKKILEKEEVFIIEQCELTRPEGCYLYLIGYGDSELYISFAPTKKVIESAYKDIEAFLYKYIEGHYYAANMSKYYQGHDSYKGYYIVQYDKDYRVKDHIKYEKCQDLILNML